MAHLIAVGLEGDVEEFGEGAAGFVAVAFDVVEAEDGGDVFGDDGEAGAEFLAHFFVGAILQEHFADLEAAGGGALDVIEGRGDGEV